MLNGCRIKSYEQKGNLIIRLTIKLLFLLVALFFVLFKNDYFSRNQAVVAEETAHETNVSSFAGNYRDRLNGYSIQQPGDEWKLTPTPRSKDLIKLDISHQSGKYGLQVRVHKQSQQSFDEFVQNYIERFKSDMKNPEILSQQSFNGKGVTGIAITFDGQQRNGYFLKSHIFPGKKVFYTLQGGCPFEQKNELEPELDKIAASFSVL